VHGVFAVEFTPKLFRNFVVLQQPNDLVLTIPTKLSGAARLLQAAFFSQWLIGVANANANDVGHVVCF